MDSIDVHKQSIDNCTFDASSKRWPFANFLPWGDRNWLYIDVCTEWSCIDLFIIFLVHQLCQRKVLFYFLTYHYFILRPRCEMYSLTSQKCFPQKQKTSHKCLPKKQKKPSNAQSNISFNQVELVWRACFSLVPLSILGRLFL